MVIGIGMIGGLGLFIFGMIFMSDALQRVAGSKLKDGLSKLTHTKMRAIILGIIVTMMIQSSSATTVMTVGFVNAGIMSLYQAIGIIMGANIGTTFVTQLISFNFEMFAPLIVGLGVLFYVVNRNKTFKDSANIFIGFGILLLGMALMKESISPLRDAPIFVQLVTQFNNPLIGLMVGLLMTAMLQSSAATAGMLIALAGSGMININMAFPVLLGSNVGTCVTALLSSIGANPTAKKAAVIHILIKVIGAFIFLIYFRFPVQAFVEWLTPLRVERQIANANTLFNLLNVMALYPFTNQIVGLSHKIIKGEDPIKQKTLKYVNDELLNTPDIAITQMKKEVIRLFDLVEKQLKLSGKALIHKDLSLCQQIFDREEKINEIENTLFEYIIKITSTDLKSSQIDQITLISKMITDLERVADLAENLAELTSVKDKNKMVFSSQALEDLKILQSKIEDLFFMTRHVYEEDDLSRYDEIKSLRVDIDEKIDQFQHNHINRIQQNQFLLQSEIIFLDALNNMERITNHSMNILNAISRAYRDLEKK